MTTTMTQLQLEVLMRALVVAHASPEALPADKKEMQAIGDLLYAAWIQEVK